MTPYYDDGQITVYCGNCQDILPTLEPGSVDLILTDPPYFRVKGDWWDRQWDTQAGFLAWIGSLADMWRGVLAPNGSLYCFASPDMAWHVEGEIRQRFNVLNSVRWRKEAGWHNKTEKEALRSFLSPWEAVIFAEHYGADNIAKGEAGYAAKCDELRGFVFEPIRSYLAGERDRAGWTTRRVAEAFQQKTGSRTVTGMAGHWFEQVQWTFPTEANYVWLRGILNNAGDDYLRREYEGLRREYEDLRRPFALSDRDEWSDVWNWKTVDPRYGKHPCEKPRAMMEHMIKASTRPGALVLDCFAGTGSALDAARLTGRRAIGIEISEKHCETIVARLAQQVLDLTA